MIIKSIFLFRPMRKSDQMFVVNLNRLMENILLSVLRFLKCTLVYVQLFMEQIPFNLSCILLFKTNLKADML